MNCDFSKGGIFFKLYPVNAQFNLYRLKIYFLINVYSIMKGKVKFNTIDEYHQSQSEEVREILELLRKTIKRAAPQAIEVISYGIPAFRYNGKVLVYYAAYKNHIGFYPTSNPIINFKKELEKFKTSKGAIQFPLNKKLPLGLIQKIVKFRLKEVKAKKDQRLSCLM